MVQSRKFKRQQRSRKRNKIIDQLIDYSKKEQITNKIVRTIAREFYLTDTDKITHIRSIDDKNNILGVINVSYETLVNVWTTVVRYDSEHGFLHRHIKFSIDNPKELVSTSGVIRKGQPKDWYTWAIQDIQKRYLEYKHAFLRRSDLS